ncbi:hypothetical protein SVAN01_07487 [Stagonosporopsis vannaccii]|nr:hypothetical protein SVAN01_07487 [Stagonosporopsis vannaccii]
MSSFTQQTPSGLPHSPRQTLTLHTTFPSQSTASGNNTPSSSTTTLYTPRRQRSVSSLIFANATIPLSPASSFSNDSTADALLEGLRPRKRSGLVRFFCCFGREERARRRVLRETGFEKVGLDGHWSEY